MTDQRSLSKNMIMNYFGAAFAALIQLAAIPLLINVLGEKAYGLVAFHITLIYSLLFLEATSLFFTRELARLRTAGALTQDIVNLVTTVERVSWGVGFVIGGGIIMAAPLIGHYWLEDGGLPSEEITVAVRLMGLAILCQWPGFMYSSGFLGAQRHDILVSIRALTSVAQYGGGLLILWFVIADVEYYLAWVACCFGVQSLVLRSSLYNLLRKQAARAQKVKGYFIKSIWAENWRFAGGAFLIAATATIMTQADKIIVSGMAPLDDFAAYALCFVLMGQVVTLAVTPMNNTLLAHFSRLMAQNDEEQLAREYHRWTQMNALILLPGFGVLAFFALPVLSIWLGVESDMARKMAVIMPVVAAGFVLNALVVVPYNLQMASGKTRVLSLINILAVVVMVPALIIVVPRYGMVAGAYCWLALNLFYFFIWVPIMHSGLLRTHLLRWWCGDTVIPIIITFLFFISVGHFVPTPQSIWFSAGAALLTAIITFGTLLLIMPLARETVLVMAGRLFTKSFFSRHR